MQTIFGCKDTIEIASFKAEQTIRRFRGRNIKTLSSSDKDVLIAAMSTIIIASAQGTRPVKWSFSKFDAVMQIKAATEDLDNQ